jgi:hypothetical protein
MSSKPIHIKNLPRPQCDAVAVARRKIGNVEYAVMSTGQLVRHRPLKPWNSKVERRQVIKQRRMERSEA